MHNQINKKITLALFLGSLFDGISGSGSILDPYAMAFGWTVFWNFKNITKFYITGTQEIISKYP